MFGVVAMTDASGDWRERGNRPDQRFSPGDVYCFRGDPRVVTLTYDGRPSCRDIEMEKVHDSDRGGEKADRMNVRGDGQGGKPDSTMLRNSLTWAITAMEVGLIVTFPIVVWFGLVVLEFPLSVIGFTVAWWGMFVVLRYFPGTAMGIRFENGGLTARYRRGEKGFRYQDVVRIVWRNGIAGGGVSVTLANGELIKMGALEGKLVDMIIAAIRDSKPDLVPGRAGNLPLGAAWGIIADPQHQDARISITWGESFGYEYFFWGRRPKKSENDDLPHVLNIQRRNR